MPGSHDPSNYQLPHQPLHKCMFQKSSYYSTLNGVTNPYNCEIDNVRYEEIMKGSMLLYYILVFSVHQEKISLIYIDLLIIRVH